MKHDTRHNIWPRPETPEKPASKSRIESQLRSGRPATVEVKSIALIVGVIIGTYSSIYVAGSSLLVLGVSGQDLDTTPSEEIDDRP